MAKRVHLDLLVGDPAIETVTIALNYLCNSRCRFCFIERELDLKLPDTPDDHIARVFAENARRKRYRRLILAGAEATLRDDLPDIANRAIRDGGFEIVRLQTNGRTLRDRSYLWKLAAAGISEYFVSVHAGTAEVDAYLTRNAKSFGEMQRGLRNLRELGVRTISNTCVSRGSYEHLPALAEFLLAEGVRESHFWSFIEFGDVGQGAEHVRHADAIPKLRDAVRTLRAAGSEVVLSWFPECLLGEDRVLLHDHRDDTLIHDEFSARSKAYGRFSCAHSPQCTRFGKGCMGFHQRYIELFGDERDALVPFRAPDEPAP